MRTSFRQAVRLFWRALRLRCPNCGGRPIFHSWFGCAGTARPADFLWSEASRASKSAVPTLVAAAVTLFLAFDLLFRPAPPDELA